MCFFNSFETRGQLKEVFKEIVAFVNLWNHFNLLFIQEEVRNFEVKIFHGQKEFLLIEVWQIWEFLGQNILRKLII